MKGYDFSGWVTKNDILCSDGVVIKRDAFKGNNNQKVPLVWNHNHNSSTSVLGHILLHSRDNGVYGYGFFNGTKEAQHAKELVQHGDISAMSIAARQIRKAPNQRDVIHGSIYEVSLVLSPANPGATIENVIRHSDEYGDCAVIYTDCILHSSENPDDYDFSEENDVEEILMEQENENLAEALLDSLDDDQIDTLNEVIYEMSDGEGVDSLTEEQLEDIADLVGEMVDMNEEEYEEPYYEEDEYDEFEHSAEEDEDDIGTLVSEALTEEECAEVFAYARELVGEDVPDDDVMDALTEEDQEELTDFVMDILDSPESEDEEDYNDMQHNVFADQRAYEDHLIHAQLCADILEEAKQTGGSLRDTMLAHGVDCTIDELLNGATNHEEAELMHSTLTTIDDLLTVETFTGAPTNIHPEKEEIVNGILSGVKVTPKHTVRARFADLTTDEARALGYIKGDEKIEEHFGTMQRVTHPQTIYKYQTLDNDDIIDIDWDVIGYMRAELKTMWRYELARAIFISDGRSISDRHKIREDRIRPIVSDDPFFVTQVGGLTANNFMEKVITEMALHYKGTSVPAMYMDKVLLAQVRLLKATDGHYLIGDKPLSVSDLADLCGVSRIITPDFLQGTGKAIVVHLGDYELAAPNKGRSQSYEDFDLKFNLHQYLLEGRCAGALVQPQAAIVFQADTVTNSTYTKATGVTSSNFASGTYYTKFAHVYNLATSYKANTTYYTKDSTSAE